MILSELQSEGSGDLEVPTLPGAGRGGATSVTAITWPRPFCVAEETRPLWLLDPPSRNTDDLATA